MKTLKDLGVKVYSGKVVQRLIADPLMGDKVVDPQRKTVVSKTVDEGFIDDENVVLNDYKALPDDEKLTKEGDIIIKLTPPYKAAIIDKEHEGMFVSSFCSIIRNVDTDQITKEYLVAYLNSDVCRRKFEVATAGSATIAMLTNTKISDLAIPFVDKEKQNAVSTHFFKMIANKKILTRIIELEEEKLASMIARLEDER